MTFDDQLGAALAALPRRIVDGTDPLHAAFAGTVTGISLVSGPPGHAIYFAVVRLEPAPMRKPGHVRDGGFRRRPAHRPGEPLP